MVHRRAAVLIAYRKGILVRQPVALAAAAAPSVPAKFLGGKKSRLRDSGCAWATVSAEPSVDCMAWGGRIIGHLRLAASLTG